MSEEELRALALMYESATACVLAGADYTAQPRPGVDQLGLPTKQPRREHTERLQELAAEAERQRAELDRQAEDALEGDDAKDFLDRALGDPPSADSPFPPGKPPAGYDDLSDLVDDLEDTLDEGPTEAQCNHLLGEASSQLDRQVAAIMAKSSASEQARALLYEHRDKIFSDYWRGAWDELMTMEAGGAGSAIGITTKTTADLICDLYGCGSAKYLAKGLYGVILFGLKTGETLLYMLTTEVPIWTHSKVMLSQAGDVLTMAGRDLAAVPFTAVVAAMNLGENISEVQKLRSAQQSVRAAFDDMDRAITGYEEAIHDAALALEVVNETRQAIHDFCLPVLQEAPAELPGHDPGEDSDPPSGGR